MYPPKNRQLSINVKLCFCILFSYCYVSFLPADLGPWLTLLTPAIGALAGCISKTAVYPLDLVKKRFQIVGFEEARKPFGKLPNVKLEAPFKFTTGRVLVEICRTEGFLGLFKGWLPSMLKAGVSTAATFTFFEMYKELIASGHFKI
ncbi:unnamed protein product [Dibothriocephalus latus]|uniref:Mitochondrial thiamine pyrophosphate carrier 1 n=1 Tax=Dibothriocephalus latus TaxID=60516 RepID=A0A3P7MKZ7_DIBLA|nr:unnamed protein product [Dibothriocephalus latus]